MHRRGFHRIGDSWKKNKQRNAIGANRLGFVRWLRLVPGARWTENALLTFPVDGVACERPKQMEREPARKSAGAAE